MFFERRSVGDRWTNEHYYKGFHREFPLASRSREVLAVAGACLMVERQLYRDVGGLKGAYVHGDYEDSDFCLRLRERGRRNWYEASVEMYHLEGQSYPSEVRRLASDYDGWLHTEIWRDALEALDESAKDSNAIAVKKQHRRVVEKGLRVRAEQSETYETQSPAQEA
jgi:GT2 family glycosyltransferase